VQVYAPRGRWCNPGPYLLARPASAESTIGEGSITMRQFRTKLVIPAIAATAGAVIVAGCGGPTTTAAAGAAGPAPVVTEQVMPGMSMPPAGITASGQDTPVATNAVSIQNFAFTPAIVTIKTGTTMTWTNRDQDSHTATAMSGPFHSPTLNTGQSYQYTFTTPGRFDYLCTIHPFMTATVVVTP
jgi:plastocyanin